MGLRKKGNIKIKTDSLQLTIYNCKDKERKSNVRLEYRFNKLEEDDLYKVIDRSKNKIFKELKYIKEVIPIVEQYYTKELIKIYNDDLKTKLIVDFRDFIVKYSEDILTKKIFDNVYDACNCQGNKDKWLERYRKKRILKFISGRQLNIFKNDLKRSIKVV